MASQMIQWYKVLLITAVLSLLCTPGTSKKVIGRLQRNVNFLLESVADIRNDVFSLREIVTDMKNVSESQLKEDTLSKDDITDQGKELAQENGNRQSFLSGLAEELDLSMDVIKQGFQHEKENLKRQLVLNAKTLAEFGEHIHNMDTQLTEQMNISANSLQSKVKTSLESIIKARTEFENKTNMLSIELEGMYENLVKTIEKNTINSEINMEHMKKLSQRIDEVFGKVTKLQNYFSFPDFKDYVQYDNSLYKCFYNKITWETARDKCIELDGYLVEIKDKDEFAFIKRSTLGNQVFVGTSDTRVEGEWRWEMNQLPLDKSLWVKGEPNNVEDNEHCANTDWRRGGLNDIPCDSKLAYVCEFSLQQMFFKKMFNNLKLNN